MDWKAKLPSPLSGIQRYGLAALSVSVALGGALLLERFGFRDVEVPLFLFAVALYRLVRRDRSCGTCACPLLRKLRLLLRTADSLVRRLQFRSALLYCVRMFALLVTWFSAVRRRVERDLRQARDELKIEVAERTQQASLLNLTHDTIFVRDMSDVITYWNRGAEELYGWSGRGKLLASALPIYCIPSSRRRSSRFARNCCVPGVGKVSSRRARLTEPRSWSRAAGRCGGTSRDSPPRYWKPTTTSPSTSGANRKLEVLNDELAKRTAELEAINKELEAFAYSVSHDLRAPLRHIAGFTELLQKNAASSLNEKSQRYMTMILESANRMGNLIDDLLAFSRIGRAETHKTMVSLDQLVQEALTEVRQETDGRNIVWKIGAITVVVWRPFDAAACARQSDFECCQIHAYAPDRPRSK